MGWKCGCIFVGEIGFGYFGTKPQHSPEKAREILTSLGYDSTIGAQPYWADLYPPEGSIVIGAFEKGAFIAYQDISEDLELRKEGVFLKAMFCYPKKDLLALGLHSAVNYCAFALYHDGKLERSFACSVDNGIMFESGKHLPEELKQYKHSFKRDGAQVFPRKVGKSTMEFDISCIGDEIVLDLTARPLGARYDHLPQDVFQTEKFEIKQK